ncbi:MAG TPA: glycosyltransferase family 4 protein [Tepidisphaeraceae bacterium]|jgi:glycosyltransferase involved in cell wall biosynthesis
MRIVHVITRMIVGGAQEIVLLCCEGLRARGHDITLITGPPIGPEGSLMDRALAGGYPVEVIDEMRRAILPAKDCHSYELLVQRLKNLRPDIVHTHSSKAGIIGRWAAARAGDAAIVHTIHGLSFTASTSGIVNAAYKMFERRTAGITDRIICVADAMRQQSLSARIGRPEQYVTVYNGIKTEPFLHSPLPPEQLRKQFGLAPEHIVVGTIARLFHLKGHEDLLDIAPALCAKFPHLRFLWVGDGLLRPAFERIILQKNLRDRFILTGLVSPARIPELTHAMDILAHPSRREGLALALAQASLAGKPVVTYNIPGAGEAAIDGKTGFLPPPFDKEKFSQAIAVLAADPGRRQTMGAAGRAFALQRFDAQVMVRSLQQVYEAALAQRRRNRTAVD